MEKKYDVIIIGAATAGSYFGKLMAEQGFKVLLTDKLSRDNIGKRLDIFHVDKELFSTYNVPEPKEGDPDYVMNFPRSIAKSPLNNYPKVTDYPFVVMRMPAFIRRLNDWAVINKAEISYETEFIDFLYDNKGKIKGAELSIKGKTVKVEANLVVDASGISAVARTKLHDNYGVENFKIKDDEKFYVILRYVKLLNPEKDRILSTCGWSAYKSWIAPQYDPDGAIIGVGQAYSYEYAEKVYQEFIKKIPLPPHQELYIEKGTTPYRRPPYSFVADGFLTLGDSACLTKPFSGEGVTAAWNLCKIAASVAGKVLAKNKLASREALWEINTQYVRNQGAKFAYLLGSIVGAVSCNLKEQEYMYKKDIVFSDKYLTDSNRYFELRMSFSETLSMVMKMLYAVISRNIRLSTISKLLSSLSGAGKLKKHYIKYPSNEADFPDWQKKADYLWSKVGNIADTCDIAK